MYIVHDMDSGKEFNAATMAEAEAYYPEGHFDPQNTEGPQFEVFDEDAEVCAVIWNVKDDAQVRKNYGFDNRD